MPHRDPENFVTAYGWATWAWVIGLSFWGGVVHYIRKVREGISERFNLSEFLGDLLTSAFAGVVTFYGCDAAGFSGPLTAALVGVSGHMGSRAIFLFERWVTSRVGRHLG